MNWPWQTGTLAQVGPLIVGAVAIWVAVLNQRRQLNAQMFIEFSARFQELLRLFPTDAWLANLNPSRPMPPQSQDVITSWLCGGIGREGFRFASHASVGNRRRSSWNRAENSINI